MPSTAAKGPSDFAGPPYSISNLKSISLQIDGDQTKLQDICDEFFNDPFGTPGRFTAPSKYLLLIVSSFPKVEVTNDLDLGFAKYQEAALLFTVWDNTPPNHQNNHYAYKHMPILYLDGPRGGTEEYFSVDPIVVGRELFGLSKVRGEIEFDELTFESRVRALYPSALNSSLDLLGVVTVCLDPALNCLENTSLLADLASIDAAIEVGGQGLTQRRDELTRRIDALQERWAGRIVGRDYHALEYPAKKWPELDVILDRLAYLGGRFVGEGLMNKALLEGLKPDPDFELLDKALADYRNNFIGEPVLNVLCSGDRNCMEWIGLRQLRDPEKFAEASHQSIIASTWKHDKLSGSTVEPERFHVHFDPSLVKDKLGLKTDYTVPRHHVDIYNDVPATYAEQVKTLLT